MRIENKFDLGFFPTPIQPLKRMSEKYPGYNLFIKRDDNSGLASGGNKTRKLEYLIQQALDNSCDTVVTSGAQQSNHCRQTAAACSVAGLECHLLLGGDEPEKYQGNLLLSHLLGAKIHFMGESRKGERSQQLIKQLEKQGRRCYLIPYGGSNIVGAIGFVNAVKELKLQMTENNLNFDYIFFASSSGGTQAGLMLGIEMFGIATELVPISIDKDETNGHPLEEIVLKLVHEGCEMFNLDRKYLLKDIQLIREYDKAGYGVITDNEKFAITELASTEGILLDPVYTGRAFYGMLDYLKKRLIPKGSNVLFWHTGGLPSNFYYADKLKQNIRLFQRWK